MTKEQFSKFLIMLGSAIAMIGAELALIHANSSEFLTFLGVVIGCNGVLFFQSAFDLAVLIEREELRKFKDKLFNGQEQLGDDFQKVLNENRWSLYE